MNKRQWKKKKKKEQMFIASWVRSYKELKKFDREYHEYFVSVKRQKYDEDLLNRIADIWDSIH